MLIIDHVEQATADNITVAPSTYISATNDDSTDSFTFDLDGDNDLSSPITVAAGETFAGYFFSFQTITIVNADTVNIRITVGK